MAGEVGQNGVFAQIPVDLELKVKTEHVTT